MSAKTAPGNLGLHYGWIRGEDFWGGPMNENLLKIDAVVNLIIKSMGFTAPPDGAVDGDCYIVGTNPTGAWAGKSGYLAVRVEGAWIFWVPQPGWRARCESLNAFVWYDGLIWRDEATGGNIEDPNDTLVGKYYDIAITVSDYMLDAEPVVHIPIPQPMVLPKNMAGSVLDMINTSTVYAQMKVKRNGIAIGTITISEGATSAEFATNGGAAFLFAAGDRLTLCGPDLSIPDFKNFGLLLRLNIAS